MRKRAAKNHIEPPRHQGHQELTKAFLNIFLAHREVRMRIDGADEVVKTPVLEHKGIAWFSWCLGGEMGRLTAQMSELIA